MARRTGFGPDIGDQTTGIDPKEAKNGNTFVIGRSEGDIYSMTKFLPYPKINPENIESKNIVQYGVFFYENGEFKPALSTIVQKPGSEDEGNIKLLEGNLIEMLEEKEIKLDSIKNKLKEGIWYGDKIYETLWNLPRKYLDAIFKIGKKEISYENKHLEGENLEKKINELKTGIDLTNLEKQDKKILKYLIENCPYIFNKDLVVGRGKLADIKLDFEGISGVQGLISLGESFGDLSYLDSSKLGANIFRFFGHYKISPDKKTWEFIPKEVVLDQTDIAELNLGPAELTYVFFFGEGKLNKGEYKDFKPSSPYLAFLKPGKK